MEPPRAGSLSCCCRGARTWRGRRIEQRGLGRQGAATASKAALKRLLPLLLPANRHRHSCCPARCPARRCARLTQSGWWRWRPASSAPQTPTRCRDASGTNASSRCTTGKRAAPARFDCAPEPGCFSTTQIAPAWWHQAAVQPLSCSSVLRLSAHDVLVLAVWEFN